MQQKFDPVTLTFDLWPWKSIGFQTLLRTMYVPSLVKIHWRILILECSQGCYAVKVWPGDLDLWPWKSIGSRFSYGLSNLDKIHWRMLILQCSQGCYAVKIWPGDVNLWPMTLKINRVPDFGQNPLKDLDSRVFTRMLRKDGQTERRKDGRTVALLFLFTTSLVRG